MNLPESKYGDKKSEQVKQNKLSNERYDIKNFVSDRPYYVNKSAVANMNNPVYRNQSHMVNNIQVHSPKVNQS